METVCPPLLTDNTMLDKIANKVIRLAAEKPEYRTRLLPLLRKTAFFIQDKKELTQEIFRRALPVLHFREIPDNLETSPILENQVGIFSSRALQALNNYWLEHREQFKTQGFPRKLFSDQGILAIFMICLHINPMRWLQANDPLWLYLLGREDLDDLIRSLKNNPELRKFVTDTGGGSLVRAILNSAYKLKIR